MTDTEPTEELLAGVGVIDPATPTRRIVTHGAVIILNGDRAWKFKRPVRLRYFDFSTPQRRRDALDDELRLNRRFAPDLYVAVHTIRRSVNGMLSLDGSGEVVDHVLEMKRFDDDALLITHAHSGGLSDELLQRLAVRIVALHRTSEISEDPLGAQRLQDVVDGNLASMSVFPQIIDPAAATELTDRITALVTEHRELLDERARAGRVRRCHGDLHLANVAIIDGEPTPFDCLEFDAEMATTDVLYDLAFLAMDLWARGLRHEANVVVNTYFDHADVDGRTDEERAFCLLPVMLAVRATVRAHVAAAEGDVTRAHEYFSLARGFTESHTPRLIAIGGGSGTGKSTIARAIGGSIDPAPGARILRTDVLRKRLAGVSIEDELPRSAYTDSARAAVYTGMFRVAEDDLTAGMSVIADAVFGRTNQSASIADVARHAGVDFTGIWLELSEAERISRIEHRETDASDADADVARRQTATLEPPSGEWRRVESSGDIATVVAACGFDDETS